jgi:hypothetical protein
MSNIREGAIGVGSTTSTSGFITGGAYDPVGYRTLTEEWNGSAWTEIADMAIAKVNAGGSGSNTAGLVTGGAVPGSPSFGSASEEFSFPPPTAAILTEGSIFLSAGSALKGFGKAAGIPSATWASGGNLNTYVDGTMGSGIQTAALKFAGMMDPGTSPRIRAETEQYNGTSWTEVSDLNTARHSGGGFGLQTASLCFGGEPGSLTNTESWNGSAWTEVNDLNTGRTDMAGFGRSTSGFSVGGKTPGDDDVNNVESWDGTSWTETTEINTARRNFAGGGVGTSGLVFGGREAPGTTGKSEFWDGSSWTEKGDLNTARYWLSGSGTSGTFALAFGGFTPPNVGNTESYNGSTWTEVADLALARRQGAGGNASANTASITFGGFATSYPQGVATEEFTADATLSTVTVS